MSRCMSRDKCVKGVPTALTVDEWRRNVLLAAHLAIPGTCASRSVSDACVMERCSPQSAPFPPRPPPKAAALRCSAVSLVLRHNSDFSCTFMSAVRFMAFADRIGDLETPDGAVLTALQEPIFHSFQTPLIPQR